MGCSLQRRGRALGGRTLETKVTPKLSASQVGMEPVGVAPARAGIAQTNGFTAMEDRAGASDVAEQGGAEVNLLELGTLQIGARKIRP